MHGAGSGSFVRGLMQGHLNAQRYFAGSAKFQFQWDGCAHCTLTLTSAQVQNRSGLDDEGPETSTASDDSAQGPWTVVTSPSHARKRSDEVSSPTPPQPPAFGSAAQGLQEGSPKAPQVGSSCPVCSSAPQHLCLSCEVLQCCPGPASEQAVRSSRQCCAEQMAAGTPVRLSVS